MCTLARLSFWVPPERMSDFETVYRKKLLPILGKHDLEESSERGRRTVEGVFYRLFELETPAEVAVKEGTLRRDSAWQELLRELGIVFGTTEPDSLLRAHFGLYRTPAGPGKAVTVGPGFRQGLWQSPGVEDGLPDSNIRAILQDREGRLWFETWGEGVSRYDADGRAFATFTTEAGLADDIVPVVLEDRQGHLWFGTHSGVVRYDGEKWVTFTTDDGLGSNSVRSILEDREGCLWFGTYPSARAGGSGERFVTFTTEDGLASNVVGDILEDREGTL